MAFRRIILSLIFCVIIVINLVVSCIMYNKDDSGVKESIAVELEANKYTADREN